MKSKLMQILKTAQTKNEKMDNKISDKVGQYVINFTNDSINYGNNIMYVISGHENGAYCATIAPQNAYRFFFVSNETEDTKNYINVSNIVKYGELINKEIELEDIPYILILENKKDGILILKEKDTEELTFCGNKILEGVNAASLKNVDEEMRYDSKKRLKKELFSFADSEKILDLYIGLTKEKDDKYLRMNMEKRRIFDKAYNGLTAELIKCYSKEHKYDVDNFDVDFDANETKAIDEMFAK